MGAASTAALACLLCTTLIEPVHHLYVRCPQNPVTAGQIAGVRIYSFHIASVGVLSVVHDGHTIVADTHVLTSIALAVLIVVEEAWHHGDEVIPIRSFLCVMESKSMHQFMSQVSNEQLIAWVHARSFGHHSCGRIGSQLVHVGRDVASSTTTSPAYQQILTSLLLLEPDASHRLDLLCNLHEGLLIRVSVGRVKLIGNKVVGPLLKFVSHSGPAFALCMFINSARKFDLHFPPCASSTSSTGPTLRVALLATLALVRSMEEAEGSTCADFAPSSKKL